MGANSMKVTTSLCCICWPRESKQEVINPSRGNSLESDGVVAILLN